MAVSFLRLRPVVALARLVSHARMGIAWRQFVVLHLRQGVDGRAHPLCRLHRLERPGAVAGLRSGLPADTYLLQWGVVDERRGAHRNARVCVAHIAVVCRASHLTCGGSHHVGARTAATDTQ